MNKAKKTLTHSNHLSNYLRITLNPPTDYSMKLRIRLTGGPLYWLVLPLTRTCSRTSAMLAATTTCKCSYLITKIYLWSNRNNIQSRRILILPSQIETAVTRTSKLVDSARPLETNRSCLVQMKKIRAISWSTAKIIGWKGLLTSYSERKANSTISKLKKICKHSRFLCLAQVKC